jgi:hypothetical protein
MNVAAIYEQTSKNPIVRNLPVAKFYYQGTHSHPVRRTVLVIENTRDKIVGYELREGKTVRSLRELSKTIKTYNKDKIAKYGDYCRLTMSSKNQKKKANQSTLERLSITALSQNLI